MDLLPRVSGVNSKPGDRRQSGGDPSRHGKRDHADNENNSANAASNTPEAPLDPLLAELDRLRTMDPSLTESGAHRAVKAIRAYTHPAGSPVPDPVNPPATPTPEATTGSDAVQP